MSKSNYKAKSMEIAPEYRDEEGVTVAVLKDNLSHLRWRRYSFEEMKRDLSATIDYGSKLEVLAIYVNINNAAESIVDGSIDNLNHKKQVDLEKLLKQ